MVRRGFNYAHFEGAITHGVILHIAGVVNQSIYKRISVYLIQGSQEKFSSLTATIRHTALQKPATVVKVYPNWGIKSVYTPWVKKGDTILLSIYLLNIDRFSQFFHGRTQLELCNKIINKDPTSPQMCCYTALWNVKNRKTSNNLNQVSCLTINQQIFNELHEPYPI